jgi:hypothetical protein
MPACASADGGSGAEGTRCGRVGYSDEYLAIEVGHVAELVGIEGGVVSGVINLESSGV